MRRTVDIGSVEFGGGVITGTVFNDEYATGKRRTGDPGLAGFTVYLDLNDDGKWESSEPSLVTAANGDWSFNIPSPGTCYIRIVPMAHYKTTAPTGGVFTFVVGKASARIGNVFAEKLLNV